MARRQLRLLLRPLRPARARFIYDPRFSGHFLSIPMDPHRAENIAAFLASEGLVDLADLLGVRPASFRALRSVHSDAYLESLTDPVMLSRVFGFDIAPQQVDEALLTQRLIVGGTKRALHFAVRSGGITVSLAGGLHHARPGSGHGFCAFNDIAVAVRSVREKGFLGRVLVVDCDLHDGDGTRVCFASDPTVHTYSIHNMALDALPAVESTSIELGANVTDSVYLAELQRTLPPLFARFEPQLVIYLAGVDTAGDDRIGNWRITERGMIERDRLVMRLAGSRPVVVLSAGGYGANAWRYQAAFYGELARGKPVNPPHSEAMTLARMRLVRQQEPLEETFKLTEADIFGDLQATPKEHRFLSHYTQHVLEFMLERYGVFERFRTLGFVAPCIELKLDDPIGHVVRVFGDAQKRELLVELCVRVDPHAISDAVVLYVEWLLMQNPRQTSGTKPLLPGQKHPGLGMANEAVGLLVMVCERLGLDGIVFVPGHYHLAAVGGPFLRFVDPKNEAFARALHELRGSRSLSEMSWALASGQIVDETTKERVAWRPLPMVFPVSERLRERVFGQAYEAEVQDLKKSICFSG